jgi:WxcM-like, C-terminal
MYYIYDIPTLMQRGGHAHKQLKQIVIAIKGSFFLKLHDGQSSKIVVLNSAEIGLLLTPGIWREVFEFTPGAVCMVLASETYSEDDYIRDFNGFMTYKNICMELPD